MSLSTSVPRIRCLTLLLLSLSLLVTIPAFAAEQNLLLNSDLGAGSDDAPEHWTMSPDAPPGSFGWERSPGASPALEITTIGILSHNYWSQTVSLEQAGWYRFRALVKTANPGSRAAVQVSGTRGSAIAIESAENWTPLEVYFKVVNPNESVAIGCGARGARGGRAFFRDLSLSRIFGAPPNGSHRLDIGEDLADLPAPEINPLAEEDFSGPERGALRGVELAKAAPDESLLRDVLRLRVLAAVLLAFALITLLDWRYGSATTSGKIPGGYLQDRELRRSAGVAAFLCLTLLGTWLVTRLEYVPGHGFYVVEPHATQGDEPHYLVMINGLLLTHSLHVQTVYDDVDRGGPEAGVIARETRLDRHTIVVNQRTGHRAMGIIKGVNGGLWHRDPRPEFAPSPDTYEISVHPPGFPVLIAAALSLMRPRAAEVEPEVGFILMLIAWLGVVVTYFVGRQTGMSRGWAILAASILFLASPWLPYSRAYFAESTIGLAIILGVWALLSDLPILAALAAGAAAAMKPPFALVAAGFFGEEVRERRWKDAVKIAAVLALGLPALAIIAHNFALHRRVLPMSQLIKTLFDPVEGLLLYAPWTIFGFLACARAFFPLAEDMRLARTMSLPLFLYLIAVSSVGYGAGYCYGPRYWVAFMPWLALGAVEAMRRGGRYQRAICGVLVLFGVAMAIPGALRYPQLFAMPAFDAWRGFR
jgi:hypothetical protein